MAEKKEPWRTMSDEEYYKALAGKMAYPDSKRLPEIFRRLLPPIEAQMILHMPAQEEDLMGKMHLDRETVDKHLKHLYEGGICNPGRKGWRILPVYWMIKDAASPSHKYDFEREYGPNGLYGPGSISERFEKLEWFPRQKAEYASRSELAETTGPGSRVITYWKAIDGIPGVEWFDDMRQILKRAEQTEQGISVGRCACRYIHGDLSRPLWTCLNFGRYTRYNVDRGAFMRVNYEEAMKVLDKVMEGGLVHRQTPNCRVVERQICNCGGIGCPSYTISEMYKVPMTHESCAPSRFEPEVDPEKCIACGKCIEGCLHKAAHMNFYEDINKWRSATDLEKCMGVGHCVVFCPTGARKMKLVRPPEFVPETAEIRRPEAMKGATG